MCSTPSAIRVAIHVITPGPRATKWFSERAFSSLVDTWLRIVNAFIVQPVSRKERVCCRKEQLLLNSLAKKEVTDNTSDKWCVCVLVCLWGWASAILEMSLSYVTNGKNSVRKSLQRSNSFLLFVFWQSSSLYLIFFFPRGAQKVAKD